MTQSMFELRIPAPIKTYAATVTIEGEIPSVPRGVVTPTWNASGSGSYWGGTGGCEAVPWDASRSYSTDEAVYRGGFVFAADGSIAAGEDPLVGEEAGGNPTLPALGSEPKGMAQGIIMNSTTDTTVVGITMYGSDTGLRTGARVKISDGTNTGGGGGTWPYDYWTTLSEGMFEGTDGTLGWGHITLSPVKLLAGETYYIVADGDNFTSPCGWSYNDNFIGSPDGWTAAGDPLDPTNGVTSHCYTSTSYGGSLIVPNVSSKRMMFKLWDTPWDVQGRGIPLGDARFKVFIGASGLDFDSITDDSFTEVSAVDATYVGPSGRSCFRLKDVMPAAPANFQSLYIKYTPTNIPVGAPNGVALYNVTAEPYVPDYNLGPHSTSAHFS